MMFLSQLKIKGYKIFNDEFTVKLNKGLTVLIGENGCGKTAIVDAIRLLLNEDEFGRLGISESHFHRPMGKAVNENESQSIEVNGTFSDLNPEQQVAYLPWLDALDTSKAYLTKRVDNKPNSRGRFDHRTWGGESMLSIFEWELINTINCIYLPPLRDAETKLEAYRGSRLSRLFKREKPKKGDVKHVVETEFENFNQKLLQQPSIAKVNEAIKKYLRESLGTVLGQDAMIQFSEINFERIVERLRLLFFPKISDATPAEFFRDIEENSLGYNNVLYLATVLAELDGLEGNETFHKMLLIEEPEAHLHPQLQIKLLQYLKTKSEKNNIQIVITTHSSTITASCGLNALNILTITSAGPISTLISDINLEIESIFFLERWLDITKSTLFFAKGILFVEGISEALVVKELAKRVIKKYLGNPENAPQSIEDYGISIINLNGIYFRHFMQLFQGYKLDTKQTRLDSAAIPIRCAGITDCDPQKVAETKPTLASPCECGNTHSKKYADELLTNDSKYCRIYTNLKTFEYDLGMEKNNLQTFYKIIFEQYKNMGAGAKAAEEKLQKDWSSILDQEKAEECFNFLDLIDKGEFAQKLAFELSSKPELDFSIPDYIEKAILWVTDLKPKESI